MATSAVRSAEQRWVPSRPRRDGGDAPLLRRGTLSTVTHPVERSRRPRRGAPARNRGSVRGAELLNTPQRAPHPFRRTTNGRYTTQRNSDPPTVSAVINFGVAVSLA